MNALHVHKKHSLLRRRALKLGFALACGALAACLITPAWAATDTAGSGQEKSGSGKKLVVYFSLPETDKAENMTSNEASSTVVVDGQVLGNTQYLAQLIQKNAGADLFRIEAKKAYPLDHKQLVDLGEVEKKNKARPEIVGTVPNISEYDVVFIGYPNWFADMPMVLYTFLESYDLSGKTIVPFLTHGGSGFSNTIASIATVQPKANVEKNGLSISRTAVDTCEPEVVSWLRKLGY